MSFVQLEFLVFFALVWAVYWRLGHQAQNKWLLAASLVFYGWIHPVFIGLLLYTAALNTGCARGIATSPEHKRRYLWASIAGNALFLGTFKYLDFMIDNVAAGLTAVGVQAHPQTLGILLPVGISFYTFQMASYTLDVYWGKIEARRDFADVLLFASFFPQLVAGPVERAGRLLPQIESPRTLDIARFRSGVSLAVWGVFKKVVVADSLAPYVNEIYAAESAAPVLLWAAAAGFMVQMLADFSAYSDIARGTARLLGFELMRNFHHPYLAASPTEFWERWHISLSNWLRDYVFGPAYVWGWGRRWLRIPFVEAGRGTHVARATIVTLLFSGLWHGAAWHFVAWGALWAMAHVTVQLVGPQVPTFPGRRVLQIGAMLGLGWVAHQVFREPSMTRLAATLTSVPWSGSADEWVVASIMATMTVAGSSLLCVAMGCELYLLPWLRTQRIWLPVETTLWCVAGWAVFTFGRTTSADFLYFAF